MNTRKPLTLRKALAGSMFTILGAAVGFGAVGIAYETGIVGQAEQVDAPTEQADTNTDRLANLTKQFDCNPLGFGQEVIPAHALIKLNGHIKVVSFDRGWKTLEGDAPGELVSVCRK